MNEENKNNKKTGGIKNTFVYWLAVEIYNRFLLSDLRNLSSLGNSQGFLMDRFLKGIQEKFVKEGGFRENLLKKRLAFRKGNP